LKPGVVVHVHDIFLPYDYPDELAFNHPHWGEQYILHALLSGRGSDVLWPGYYLQRDRSDFYDLFPFLRGTQAQSFWFRWK